MSKKLGGKKLLIITTCVSVIAAVSLFRDEPQNLLAGTKTALYNGQNVVYDSQKAGGSQVAYKTYCTDSNCTFQYAGEGSDKKIAVINMDKESTVMSEIAEIVDADLIDMQMMLAILISASTILYLLIRHLMITEYRMI